MEEFNLVIVDKYDVENLETSTDNIFGISRLSRKRSIEKHTHSSLKAWPAARVFKKNEEPVSSSFK